MPSQSNATTGHDEIRLAVRLDPLTDQSLMLFGLLMVVIE